MYLPPRLIRSGLRLMRMLFEARRVSLAVKRRLVDVLAGGTRPPAGVYFSRVQMAGIPVERIRFDRSTVGSLLYLHGGGYALGSARGYRSFVAQLAAGAGTEALVPDYSRSPEAAYPIALDETLRLYEELIARNHPAPIAIVGDSAGGGLALALAMKIRDRGLPAPAVVGLICPWADLAADVSGRRADRHDPLITPRLTAEWARPYVAAADPRDPGISPVFGDLSGLPPIIVHSAPDDPIAADAEVLEARCGEQRVADELFTHRRFPGLWHVFHLQHGFLAAADDAVRDLAVSLRRHLIDPVSDPR